LDGPAPGTLHLLRIAFLDIHVFELAGFEDLATLEAFDKFGVFIARNDLDAWMAARLWNGLILRLRGNILSYRIHTENHDGRSLFRKGMRGILERQEGLSSREFRNSQTQST
jgi:hypothetical protein